MRKFVASVALFACVTGASTAMAADESVSVDLGNGQSMKFVLIHAGTFEMGSPEGEKGRKADEAQHEVRIGEDFYMGAAPVTRGQFGRFVSARNYRTEAETGTSGGYGVVEGKLVQRREFTWKNPGFNQTDEHPVCLVTVKDANAFIAWASQLSGRKMMLPSEAQYEYAMRAGTTTRFYDGDEDADADAIGWYKDNSDGATHPVMQKQANAWGLYDMAGNVFEWCSTTYGVYMKFLTN